MHGKQQDANLLADLRTGDPQAVKVWHDQYYHRVLQYISSRVKTDKDAEELTQETFMNCLRHLPLFRGNSSVWTWMCSIAKHEIADYFRKKYAKKTIQTLPLGDRVLAAEPKDAHFVASEVKAVLKKMGGYSAELLKAKYVDKKKVKEIAKEFGKSVKAIESELFRAREEFRVLWAALE